MALRYVYARIRGRARETGDGECSDDWASRPFGLSAARGKIEGVKVLICGSRDWADRAWIKDFVDALAFKHGPDVEVIHGACRGADQVAGKRAEFIGLKVTPYPAKWKENGVYNPRAGIERNRAMLDQNPDHVVAFQFNGSSGTQDTIDEARRRGIPVHVYSAPR